MSKRKESPRLMYFILLLLYLIVSVFVRVAALTQGTVMILGNPVPYGTFTGVLSSLANICIIFMVVFFGTTGFYTSITLILLQFPLLVNAFTRIHNVSSLSGLFNNLLTVTAITLIYRRNKKIEEYRKTEMDYLKNAQKTSRMLFEQTASAMVNAIDAKDTFSHGHSRRVAEYSEAIARALGKEPDECREIYYTALLHDVGKIGVPNTIINKNGKLTEEEYEIIKQHTIVGDQILSGISEYPYLRIGARSHHERYDGQGYPDRLKGEDIPEIARIIAVADAYDAMTSNRSFRRAMPQQLAREELVKCAGTQFDPALARIMQHLIDLDTEYQMREKDVVMELAGNNELKCQEFRSAFSDGILLTRTITGVHIESEPDGEEKKRGRGPAFILFDSLDGRVHEEERVARDLCYYEYCTIWMDGHTDNKGARVIKTETSPSEQAIPGKPQSETAECYDIEAVKCDDHVLFRITSGENTTSVTIALPDSSRYAYMSLTGEQCHITNVSIDKQTTAVPEDYIPRIAERRSFIDGPVGDIPNLQVDGHRTAATIGIPLKDILNISFHTMSLPTSRLVWHCPFYVIFSSKDGKVFGVNYREYALIRLDGEFWDSENAANNRLTVNKKDNFESWEYWKEMNRQGFNSSAFFSRSGNIIEMSTENLGITIKNTTTITDGTEDIYVAITGDQVALTDIRIN